MSENKIQHMNSEDDRCNLKGVDEEQVSVSSLCSTMLTLLKSRHPELTGEQLRELPEFQLLISSLLVSELDGNKLREDIVHCNTYVAHLKNTNYDEELYLPLKNSKLTRKLNFIFPYGHTEVSIDSREVLKNCKYMIAEVSQPSITLGMEIERAVSNGVKVVCIFKRGYNLPSSLKQVTDVFIKYNDSYDMVEKLEQFFNLY